MLGESPVRAATNEVGKAAPAGARHARRAVTAARRAVTAPPGSARRDPVVWGIAALSFGAYFVISLYRLLRLTPGSYDLGIYTEFVKQLSLLRAPVADILRPGFNLEGNHFQIAVGVIAPFFRIFPTPATLLFFQAFFAALSVFPVAAVACLFTGRSTGRLIAFGYAFSWGLQQMINFDFHEIALAVPLLAFSVSALVRCRPGAAVGWAMPLVFVEESQGFTVAAIGMLLGATAAFPRLLPARPVPPARSRSRSRRRWRWPAWLGGRLLTGGDPWDYSYAALWGGALLVAWGLLWSTFAITVIIPHFNPQHQYYFWKDGGVIGGGKPFSAGALLSQFGSGWPTKLQTVVLLLLPTAFAALGSPVALLALPSLLLRFLSANASYWGTQWHYDATIMPILFIAAAEAIGRWQRTPAHAWPTASRARASGGTGPSCPRPGRGGGLRDLVHHAKTGVARHGGAMMAAVAVALAFQFPLSALWHGSTYKLSAHVAAANAAMAVVPDGVTVTTTLDLLAPLAARTDTFWIGNPGNPPTQYIVFDGADSGYSPPVKNVPKFIARWYHNDGYVQVFEKDDVYVYRRGLLS